MQRRTLYLSNVKPLTQETLSRDWGGFYKALTSRNILSLDGLVEELVSQLLERHMKKKTQDLIKNPDNIKLAIVRKQSQLLNDWLRAQQAEQSAQMATVKS